MENQVQFENHLNMNTKPSTIYPSERASTSASKEKDMPLLEPTTADTEQKSLSTFSAIDFALSSEKIYKASQSDFQEEIQQLQKIPVERRLFFQSPSMLEQCISLPKDLTAENISEIDEKALKEIEFQDMILLEVSEEEKEKNQKKQPNWKVNHEASFESPVVQERVGLRNGGWATRKKLESSQ